MTATMIEVVHSRQFWFIYISSVMGMLLMVWLIVPKPKRTMRVFIYSNELMASMKKQNNLKNKTNLVYLLLFVQCFITGSYATDGNMAGVLAGLRWQTLLIVYILYILPKSENDKAEK